jgi:hypothetical protein
MSIFTRLPITVASALPTIPQTDIDTFVSWEPDSYEHWIFDKGNSANLTGLNQGKVLTAQGTAPTYAGTSLSLLPTIGNGLLTDKTETANQVGTMFCVFKAPVNWNGFGFLFGTLSTGTGNIFGGSPFLASTAGSPRIVFLNDRNLSPASSSPGSVVSDQWYFFAQSRDFNSATKKRLTVIGGAATFDETPTGTYAPATGRFIALGNGYYSSGASSLDPTSYAEFGIFDRALSDVELQALYLRRKSAMAANGITVV